jgi:uncharacterized phage protein (predicted DNA packaging)
VKVSEITEPILVEYLRLNDEPDEIVSMTPLLESAKSYVKSYTGLTDAQLDEHEDITIAIHVLVQDMYDNRSMYVDKNNVNKVVDTILGMHCVNLL